ncbi:MAG: hypothetical protein ACTSP4_08670 [Candidatus Hodarchaeales archaeon]
MKDKNQKLMKMNLKQGSDKSRDQDSKLKIVTIRGVDQHVYSEFAIKIKEQNKNIGEVISQMMVDVLTDFDEVFPGKSTKNFRRISELPKARIEHHDELLISAKDLMEANSRFSFNNIKYLELGPDIAADDLIYYIRDINHCHCVRYPSSLPKLLLYSKVRGCETLEMYDVAK